MTAGSIYERIVANDNDLPPEHASISLHLLESCAWGRASGAIQKQAVYDVLNLDEDGQADWDQLEATYAEQADDVARIFWLNKMNAAFFWLAHGLADAAAVKAALGVNQ